MASSSNFAPAQTSYTHPIYESKLQAQNSFTSSTTIPFAVVNTALATIRASRETVASSSSPRVKLPNGPIVPQITMSEVKTRVLSSPAPALDDAAYVKEEMIWQTKFSEIKGKLEQYKINFAHLRGLSARYFCSPMHEEPAFQIVENGAEAKLHTFLFSQGTCLRICIMINKMVQQGSTKRVFEAWALDLHPKKPIQITHAAISLIHNDINGERRQKRVDAMKEELHYMSKLDHPAICTIIAAAIYPENGQQQMMLVMPYFPHDFGKYFEFKSPLHHPPLVPFIKRMLGALAECEKKGIVNCDIKPENILCDAQGNPTCSDFGLANNRYPGTTPYKSLHYVLNPTEAQLPSHKWDIWSMGDVFYLLGLLHRDVIPAIKIIQGPEFIESKPHVYLPWGRLIQVYEDLNTALKILSKPHMTINPTAPSMESEKFLHQIKVHAESVINNLQKCDCSTWIRFEKYSCRKLLDLTRELKQVSELINNALIYQETNIDNQISITHLQCIRNIMREKLKDMQHALRQPYKVRDELEWAIFYMLHPDRSHSAEELLGKLPA